MEQDCVIGRGVRDQRMDLRALLDTKVHRADTVSSFGEETRGAFLRMSWVGASPVAHSTKHGLPAQQSQVP